MDSLEVVIDNFRCVKNLNIGLNRINVFLGKNSTGKSSIAYALYMASMVSSGEEENIDKISNLLLASDLQSLARMYNGKRHYPIRIKIQDESNLIEIICKKPEEPKPSSTEEPPKEPMVSEPPWKILEKGKIWDDQLLAVSGRYGLLISYQIFSNLLRHVQQQSPQIVNLLASFAQLIYQELPLWAPAPILIKDLLKVSGIELPKLEIKEITGLGFYSAFPLMQIITHIFTFKDLIDKEIELTASQAPSGLVDASVILSFLEGSKKNSLLILEEPEEHLNPRKQIDVFEQIISNSKSKDLTTVITTHSEICVYTFAKAIREGIIDASDVSIYYLKERTKKNRWTTIERIEIDEDGSMEPIPDSLETTVHLF